MAKAPGGCRDQIAGHWRRRTVWRVGESVKGEISAYRWWLADIIQPEWELLYSSMQHYEAGVLCWRLR